MHSAQPYTSPSLPPVVGEHPDDAEARSEAIDAAISRLADDALSDNGRASEAICGYGVAEGLRGLQNKPFDPKPWLQADGNREPLPRDDCPCDVLEMFVWTGSQAQVIRAVYLLRDRARELIGADSDIVLAAQKAVEHAKRRSKGLALGYYSAMALEAAA